MPVIRRNERLIITKNYVGLDERIVPHSYYPLPRSAYSPRGQEEELCADTHRVPHVFTYVLVTSCRCAIAVAENFFHPAPVFASNGLANVTSVTYRSRLPSLFL